MDTDTDTDTDTETDGDTDTGSAGADAELDVVDAVGIARRLADDLLFPAAQDVDRADLVPSSHLDALAEAGLFGLAAARVDGGLEPDPVTARRIFAAVASGCGATFFVWVQHHGAVRALATTSNDELRREVLPELVAGRSIAGTAFAHLRRSGPPAITATPIDGGWRFDGDAPWATSWGIADWFTVAAVGPDERVVWALLPAAPEPGVIATPLDLPVFGATGTVAVRFDGWEVSGGQVLAVESLDRWRAADRVRAAIGQPGVLGVADRAIRLLASRSDGPAVDVAGRLGEELVRRWAADADLAAAPPDRPAGEAWIESASDHRAGCLDLARRSTTALLAAVGGGGMDRAHPAQRLAREADFFVIQAQTADGRAATLRSV